MKTNKLYFGLAGVFAFAAALVFSACKDEGVDLAALEAQRSKARLDSIRFADSLERANNKLQRFYDSLDSRNQAVADSLLKIGKGGLVSYAITVVDGSTSSFANGKVQSLVSGAAVTISQFGRTETKTTGASGLVVFSGYFRNSINVTINQTGFTQANYVVGVRENNATPNNSWNYVGNIIPIFPTTGPNTATISGRATIQSNLTNKTRELVPDGTTVLVGIDADNNAAFENKFLFMNKDGVPTNLPENEDAGSDEQFFYVGDIKQANYQTGVVGSTTNGLYTVTVPAAFDGLPLRIDYSDVAVDQTMFESTVANGDRTVTRRAIFGQGVTALAIPTGTAISIGFDAGTGAAGTAVISNIDGSLKSINVTAGGSGYVVAPEVVISAPDLINGTQATATATVTNGSVTGITLVNAGTGYKTAPTVGFLNGGGALANAGLNATGTVTGVTLVNTGLGYTSAPAVTFSAPVDVTGTTATGTANIDAQGRVTSITITNAGSKYNAAPTVTIAAAPAGGVNATGTALWTGQSVGNINLTNGGANYLSAPIVVLGKPNLATGTQATAVAVYDAATKTVSAIQVTAQGSGYTSAPLVTITAAGIGATAQALLDGGSVLSVNITNQGTSAYVAAPTVTFTGGDGSGATGTAIVQDGKVVGVTITNGGTGYSSAPTVTFSAGDGAVAYATVTNGVISAITVTDGGRNWVGAPRVTLTSTQGGGATATATVAGGSITGVTVTAGGTGYIEGNVPGTAESFSGAITATSKPGIKYINDIHYGTGAQQPN